MRGVLALLVGSSQACVAANDRFEGPGFHDAVDGYDPLRWPDVDRGWSVDGCAIDGSAGGGSHWRAGSPGMCGSPEVPGGKADLVSAEIPVFGHDVTLRFSTRIALPRCPGADAETLAVARVFLEVAGDGVRLVPASIATAGEDLVSIPAGLDALPTLGGRSAGEDWVGVEAAFVVPDDADRVRLVFTYGWQAARCDVSPLEETLAECCDALRADPAAYTGWQVDDVDVDLVDTE